MEVSSRVHYVAFGDSSDPGCCAAIVTNTNVDDDEIAVITLNPGEARSLGERVDLCILFPSGISFKESVQQDEPGRRVGTWHLSHE